MLARLLTFVAICAAFLFCLNDANAGRRDRECKACSPAACTPAACVPVKPIPPLPSVCTPAACSKATVTRTRVCVVATLVERHDARVEKRIERRNSRRSNACSQAACSPCAPMPSCVPSCPCQPAMPVLPAPPPPKATEIVPGACDALAELNIQRQRRGLFPFLRDDLLAVGAARCAVVRARCRCWGHTQNDFSYLPAGARSNAAGAGMTGTGFLTCYCDSPYHRYAGAAYAIGPDGQRYCHLFVR